MLLAFYQKPHPSWVLFLIVLVFAGNTVASTRPVSRPPKDFVTKLDPTRELSFWEKQIQKQAIARNYEATKGELALAASNPLAVWRAIDLSLDAHLYSSELCNLPNPRRDLKSRGRNMAETDAIRHFIGAALVTYELGPQLAERFLVAHEVTDFKFADSSRMDIYNNELGVFYAVDYLRQERQAGLRPSEERFLKELKNQALDLLEQGEYSVLKTETMGDCRVSSSYPNSKHQRVPKSYKVLSWNWQE